MALKLLCFDLDNTLWPVEPVIARAEEASWQWLRARAPELNAAISVETLRAKRLALFAANPHYIHNLTALRRDALQAGLEAGGLSAPHARELAAGALAEFLDHRNRVEFFPGAVAALEQLAGEFRLAAISNGNADLVRIGLAPLFDVVLSAEKVGRAKPDPAMFEHALRATSLRANEALHVGDHPEQDIQAAQAHGLLPVWANPLRLLRPPELAPWVRGFEDFAELPALVRELAAD